VDPSQASCRITAVGVAIKAQVSALLDTLTHLVETIREMIEVYETLHQADVTLFPLPSLSLDRLRVLLESSRTVRTTTLQVRDNVVSAPFAFLFESKCPSRADLSELAHNRFFQASDYP
jgi:hypothetical protein